MIKSSLKVPRMAAGTLSASPVVPTTMTGQADDFQVSARESMQSLRAAAIGGSVDRKPERKCDAQQEPSRSCGG